MLYICLVFKDQTAQFLLSQGGSTQICAL